MAEAFDYSEGAVTVGEGESIPAEVAFVALPTTEAPDVEGPVVWTEAGATRALVDPRPPERFSMSFLQAAERCLLSAHLGRVSDPSGDPAVVGHVVHEALAALGLIARSSGDEVVGAAVGRRVIERVLEGPEENEPISLEGRDKAIEMVERVAATYAFPVDADEFAVELNSRIDLDGNTLSARIDQAAKYGTTAEVDDWKTGPGLPSDETVLTHVQLPIYAYHLSVRWPDVERFVLRERYVRYGGTTRTVELERAELANVEAWLRTVVARVRAGYAAGEFPATPGSWCGYCPAKMACTLPLWQRPAAITSELEAEALFAQVLVQTEQVAEGKAALRAWLEDRELDGLVQGDRRIGFTEGTRRSFDKKRALADLDATEDDYTNESPKVEFAITKAAGE